MKFAIRTILLLCLLWAGMFAVIERMIGPAYSPSLLRKLEPGMTKQQVQDILGPPSSKSNENSWIYERSGNFGWVAVEFDTNSCFVDINDESVFPFAN